MLNMNPASLLKMVGRVDPKTVTTEQLTDIIDMGNWLSVLAVLLTGDMAANATVDMSCIPCDYDGTGSVAAIKVATQRATHASDNDGTQIVMSIRAAELAASGKQYCKFRTVSAGTGGPMALLVLGVSTRWAPEAGALDGSPQVVGPSLGSVIETVF